MNKKMEIFKDNVQDNYESDFGFTQVRTKQECQNPVFADKRLHRIAIMKDFHIGSPGDIDEGGIPGWVSKYVCTGCCKTFKIRGSSGLFHVGNKD